MCIRDSYDCIEAYSFNATERSNNWSCMNSSTLLSNEEKAVAVVKALITGDSTILRYISDTEYIQHNLSYEDGKSGIRHLYKGSSSGITIEVHRVFSDDNIVVLHSTYGGTWNEGTPQVVFDLFRFQDGLIVEHWDNLQNINDPAIDIINGNTQVDGTIDIRAGNALENKQLVESVIKDLYIGRKYATVNASFHEQYIQHSIGTPNGTDWISPFLIGLPQYASLKYIFGAGDFVITLSETFPNDEGGEGVLAFFDLFRLEEGKVKEHWDVIQTIPPRSDWKNENGKWGLYKQ